MNSSMICLSNWRTYVTIAANRSPPMIRNISRAIGQIACALVALVAIAYAAHGPDAPRTDLAVHTSMPAPVRQHCGIPEMSVTCWW
jgi:hypothetical protein